MRILIDMNLTPRWVGHLRNAGYEADHWASLGPVEAKDREICDYLEQDLARGAVVAIDWSGQPRARLLPLR